MKRSEILLGLVLVLLAVYAEANEKKNQKNFFDFWSSEKAAPAVASDDIFLEGGSGDQKENTRGDDEDFDSLDMSGDWMTNQNINLIDDDEDDDVSEEKEEMDDIVIKEDNSNKKMDDNDDEDLYDLYDGSGSGAEEEVIMPVNVKPVETIPGGKPVSPLSPCQNLLKSVSDAHRFVPECDDFGAFKKQQCYKDMTRCWCVNSNGVEIQGTTKWHPEKPDCESALVTPSMKSKKLQCDKEMTRCWCTNSNGDEIPGTNKWYPAKPDCEFGENLSTCVFQLVQHSQGLLGAYKPTCTLKGHYEPIQCQGSECWCVDKMGNEIIGSIRNKPEIPKCEQMEKPTTEKTVDIKFPDSHGGYDIGPNEDLGNKIDVFVDPITIDDDSKMQDNEKTMQEEEEDTNSINDKESQYGNGQTLKSKEYNLIGQPGLLAAIIGATVVGLLCIVLLVMFVVYRMRKKDEGSYPLEEQKYPSYQYAKAPEKEFYA